MRRITAALSFLLWLASSGCILLVNEVSDGQGGQGGNGGPGGNPATTGGGGDGGNGAEGGAGGEPTSGGGGAGGTIDTCPGGPIGQPRVSESFAQIYDVTTGASDIRWTYRGIGQSRIVRRDTSLTVASDLLVAPSDTPASPLVAFDTDHSLVGEALAPDGVLHMIDHDGGANVSSMLSGFYPVQAALQGSRLYASAIPSQIAAIDIDFDGSLLTATPSMFAALDPSHAVNEIDVFGSFAAWSTGNPADVEWCSAPNCARPEATVLDGPRELALGTDRIFVVVFTGVAADRRVQAIALSNAAAFDAFDEFSTRVEGVALVGSTVVFGHKEPNGNLEIVRCCGSGPLDQLAATTCQHDALDDTGPDDVIEMFAGPGTGVTLWLRSTTLNDRVLYVSWAD